MQLLCSWEDSEDSYQMHHMRSTTAKLRRRRISQISPCTTCCTSWHVGVEFSNRNSAYEEMQYAVQCLGTCPKVSQTGSSKNSKKELYVEPRLRWAAEGVGLAFFSRGSHHATYGRQSGERWDGRRLLTYFARLQRVTSSHVELGHLKCGSADLGGVAWNSATTPALFSKDLRSYATRKEFGVLFWNCGAPSWSRRSLQKS